MMDYEPNDDEPTVEELQKCIGMLSAAYRNLRTALESIEIIAAEAAASEGTVTQEMYRVAADALMTDDVISDPNWISEPTDEERADLAWHALTGE